jgi:hypothetical protein
VRAAEVKCIECGRRPAVLVVCGVTPDGKAWFEVYAEYKVHVVVRQQLTTPTEGETLAEELLTLRLPWSCAELYTPDNLRATHTILPRLAVDELTTETVKGLIKEILYDNSVKAGASQVGAPAARREGETPQANANTQGGA